MGREESWFTTGEKLPGEFEWVLGGGGWLGSGLNYTERGRGRGGGEGEDKKCARWIFSRC